VVDGYGCVVIDGGIDIDTGIRHIPTIWGSRVIATVGSTHSASSARARTGDTRIVLPVAPVAPVAILIATIGVAAIRVATIGIVAGIHAAISTLSAIQRENLGVIPARDDDAHESNDGAEGAGKSYKGTHRGMIQPNAVGGNWLRIRLKRPRSTIFARATLPLSA
jgi:hypothetical protein